MEYTRLDALRRSHPAWRLLAAEYAPMIVDFLHRAFIEPNARGISQTVLTAKLDDYLHQLREQTGPESFPRSAIQYLDGWASDEQGWLRKYYPHGSDEPSFDATPAAEKAIAWVATLSEQAFVGTESRLNTVFDLLRQIAEGTERDPQLRIAELEKRRDAIEVEIEAIRKGRLDIMDPSQVKDRFQQLAATARELLSDFRQVEQNFRDLDRDVRERIATWEGSKGALLAAIFGERDAISDSDQGRSFRAFWDLLMSPTRQEELSELLESVFRLEPVQQLAPDRRLLRIHYDWLEAGEAAQRTVARVSQQLRRYLDDQTWLENRRIVQLIREIEQHALALRDLAPPRDPVTELDTPIPQIELPMERPLFSPPFKPTIAEHAETGGDESIPTDALLDQIYVDKLRLAQHIRRALQARNQVRLSEVVRSYPLEQGLAELVAYMSLAAEGNGAVIDDARTETFSWTDPLHGRREATLPLVVFTRTGAS